MVLRRSLRGLGVIIFLLLHCLGAGGRDAAGEEPDPGDSPWSPPQLLFERPCDFPCRGEPKTVITTIVADPAGVAHLFWQSGQAIYHARVVETDPQEARDILVELDMPFGVGLCSDGVLHLAAASTGRCLVHLTVPIQRANEPLAWSPGACLDDLGATSPDLALDRTCGISVLYPQQDQKSLALIRSMDGGQRWTYPVVLTTTDADPEAFIGYPRLLADDRGRLHAIWGEVQAPDGYPWRRILYAQSVDGGGSWSMPIELAGERQAEPNLATYQDVLHVVWNGDVSLQERYYRFSSDGGFAWSPREAIPVPRGNAPGLQGPPALVVDSTGTAHMLISEGRYLYYITRTDTGWSTPILIAGPENAGPMGDTSELNYPSLAITGGNRLHALYTRDLQAVYYQQRTLEAPAEAAIAWLSSEHAPTVISSPAPITQPMTSQPLASTGAEPNLPPPPRVPRGWDLSASALGGLMAGLVVLGIVVFSLLRLRC